MSFRLHIPRWQLLLLDFLGIAFSFVWIMLLTPFSTQHPWHKYLETIIAFCLLWWVFGYFFNRYSKPVSQWQYGKFCFNALMIALFSSFVLTAVYYWVWTTCSMLVLHTLVTVSFLIIWAGQSLFFAYRYALNPEDFTPIEHRNPQAVLNPPHPIDQEAFKSVEQAFVNLVGREPMDYFSEHLDLRSSNTTVLSTTELFAFEKLRPFRYDVIINLRSLNNIRGINRIFSMANEKLADQGLFGCCFKDKDVTKHEIVSKYPRGINWVIYSCYYFVKRVIPKIFLTSHLYYDITNGKKRVLSKTEVLGRLCYCGFEIVDERRIGRYTYVVARRKHNPPEKKRRRYGPIIALNRVGKNGRVFKFYKARTMYPYSEFLQQYMYEHYHLQEGGKFANDMRVSTVGKFMRKCWIDELPMFINFFKGDVKLVGVRPLSNQYFNLYCDELKQLRTQFKPGLFPPFYADMPKTLDEIQDSELRYLKMCKQKGTLVTDLSYLWKIFVNIVFKRARSH